MNQTPVASDWAAARGKKWCDHIAGMEATLAPVDEPLIHALHLMRLAGLQMWAVVVAAQPWRFCAERQWEV